MKAIGVDLATKGMALVATHDGNVITTHKYVSPARDRFRIATDVYEEVLASFAMARAHGFDSVFMEEPVVAGVRNLRTSLAIAQVAGVVFAAARKMERVILVPVSTWKAGTVGKGNADKQCVRSWLTEHHPQAAKVCGGDQDLIDACCCALDGERFLARVQGLGRELSDGPRPS